MPVALAVAVASEGSSALPVVGVVGGVAASPIQSGLLLLDSNGQRRNEAQTISITP